MTRYPQTRVSIRSPNPLALVAAVREELRQIHAEPEEIQRFSDEAMHARADRQRLLEICRQWITLGNGDRAGETDASEVSPP